jgi:putative ATP-dependent endonuclease of OLD family
VVVEGSNDVEFLTRIGRILHRAEPMVPDLGQLRADGHILFKSSDAAARTSLATSTLVGCRQFHLLDRESSLVCQERRQLIDVLNQFPDCRAALTSKRTIENYLHPAAILEASGLALSFADADDVATLAARARLQATAEKNWESLSLRARRRLRGKAKKWLNRDAVDRMTVERLAERDAQGEIRAWLLTIALLAGESGTCSDSAGHTLQRPS